MPLPEQQGQGTGLNWAELGACGLINSPRDHCESCQGEQESPRREKRVTGQEKTTARSMSIVRGNLFPFPSVFRAFSDPSKMEPLPQGAEGSASCAWEPELLCCWALTSLYGPDRDWATFVSFKAPTIVFKLQTRFHLISITRKLN